MVKIDPRVITIRKKRWKLKFCSLPKGLCGEADPPSETGKEVRISSSIHGQELLDTIIHECFHCGHWDIDESVVEEFATDLARILWGLGYRTSLDSKDAK